MTASAGVLLLSLFPDFLDYLWSGRDGSDERAEGGRHRLSERDADNRASESDDREDRIGGSGDDHADVLRFMVLGRDPFDVLRASISASSDFSAMVMIRFAAPGWIRS